ncbi:PREDICTED: ubiquinol-cytochrome-c reductase complex assembly factor 1-like [Amphimedon queenslandica]|uniref:Ubiquinol-cytochrome c chaperone domain-containing protein n=1 Tax=Amphimedon queenslandica TaxID=400682 RepID=A0A1X7VGS5_AMPQE|nr:PREDICTED: ubiquinol-cytochrome-c reductase complex assembly factor 1-like [Amphimedon queenslandica]|eukprot:XP_003384330.1 PREDICTED: ubiquinol-cytochrome-c reductase complex assembly factor 1-like [Amphimedon queenslandica]
MAASSSRLLLLFSISPRCFQRFQSYLNPAQCLLHQKFYYHSSMKRTCLYNRPFSSSYSSASSEGLRDPNSLGERILTRIGWLTGFFSRKEVLKRSAVFLYSRCINEIDYESFIKTVPLPDTFGSWFLIAHLHIWLFLVRLKREGEDGRFITHQLVNIFWTDTEERMRALGVKSGKLIQENLHELNLQFRGLIIAYEEGLLSNDMTLASAFWRNWISKKSETDPEGLSQLVEYVRKQVQVMDKGDTDKLLREGTIKMAKLTLRNETDKDSS